MSTVVIIIAVVLLLWGVSLFVAFVRDVIDNRRNKR